MKKPLNSTIPQAASHAPPEQPPQRFIGLDVHKREVTAAAVDAGGRLLWNTRFELDDGHLEHFLRSKLTSGDAVALEATTNCWAVAERLRPHVARVVVSNPMATKAIAAAKVKTDKVDAQVLAQLLRCDYLPEVWTPDHPTQLRRQLCARRTALVQDRTAVRNRVHSVLAMRLITVPQIDLFSSGGRQWIEKLVTQERLDATGKLLIDTDLVLHDQIDEQLQRIEQELTRIAWQEEQVKLLMTITGIDVAVAVSVLAAIGDVSRFASPDALAAYFGLVPSTRQSAQSCYHGPITKRGSTMGRWLLIQAAQHMARSPGPLGHFFARLKRKKGHNVALVAVARKLARIIWFMLMRNEPYRYAVPRSTDRKLARLRIRATGQVRRGGTPKGVKAQAKVPGGARTIPPLDDVYERSGLPRRGALPAGEQRHVEATGTRPFMESIGRPQVIPRGGRREGTASEAEEEATA